MEAFTPLQSTLGGVLIGLSAAGLWALGGRVAGISGIAGAVLPWNATKDGLPWRLVFLLGLVVAGAVAAPLFPDRFSALQTTLGPRGALVTVVLAGLLVGIGTRMGGGCTSGHGICGIGRFAPRSFVATGTFMAVAMVTVFVSHQLLGWS